MNSLKLFDAEYRLMDIIWEMEPVGSTELCRVCAQRLGWKKPTTYTVLRKLAGKGILKNENATVTSLVGRPSWNRTSTDPLRPFWRPFCRTAS